PAGEGVKRLRFPLKLIACRPLMGYARLRERIMNNAPSPSLFGWWLLSWLAFLALAAGLALVLARRGLAPGHATADVLDAVLTRDGGVSFLRTSAFAVLLTVMCAIALLAQLVGQGFASWSQINEGALLAALASGFVITLAPHYLLCRWLRNPLRQGA